MVEALRHAGVHHGAKVEVDWVDSESVGEPEVAQRLHGADGILIPGGFGGRGWEGKIRAAQIAREQQDPLPGHLPGHARRGAASSPATSPAWRAPTRPRWTSRPRSR